MPALSGSEVSESHHADPNIWSIPVAVLAAAASASTSGPEVAGALMSQVAVAAESRQ
jgi:hypothetical protein